MDQFEVNNELVIPALREDLVVEKREIITGVVRIRKVVHEDEQVVEQPLITSGVEVERVPLNRIVTGPIPVRYEGDTAIFSVMEEVLVVTKQYILKEELRVTTRASETYDRQRVTLRTEELVVERAAVNEPSQFNEPTGEKR